MKSNSNLRVPSKIESFYSIENEVINDANWTCMVVFLIESEAKHLELINLFEYCALSDRRPVIKNIKPKDINISKLDKGDKITNLAMEIKKYILNYKSADIKKRTENILQVLGGGQEGSKKKKTMQETKKTEIRDEPNCGAFVYFVLTKFYEPLLPGEMLKIGIPLIAIFELGEKKIKSQDLHPERASDKIKKSEGTSGLQKFWLILVNELSNESKEELFTDVLLLPIHYNCISNLENQTRLKEKGELLYDHICQTLFKLNKYLRYHIHYLHNMKRTEILTITEEERDREKNIYKAEIEAVPFECTTMEFIVYSIIEQVDFNISELTKNNSKSSYEMKKNEYFLRSIENNPQINYMENNPPKTLWESMNVAYNDCTPTFINHRDIIGKKVFHLPLIKFNLKEINNNKLSLMPYIKLWELYPEQDQNVRVCYNNHLYKLLKKINGMYSCSTEQMHVYLHQIIFNKMCEASTQKKVSEDEPLVREIKSILSDVSEDTINTSLNEETQIYPGTYTKRKKEEEKLRKFLEIDEITNLLDDLAERNLELQKYNIVEEIEGHNLVQILKKCYESFLSLDYVYSNLTDQILIWFHNDVDDFRLNKSYFEGKVCVPIGFRDFYFHELENEKKWLKKEKEKMKERNEENLKFLLMKMFPGINPLLIMFNSNFLLQIPFPVKMSGDIENQFHNVGYEGLGSKLIKETEEVKTFYSVDGPTISVKQTKWHSKDSTLTIILNCYKNLFTLHQQIPTLHSNVINSSDTYFHIETNKEILFSCIKRKSSNVKESAESTDGESSEIVEYDLMVSLPTGLMIEFVRGETPYVKQYHLSTFNDSPLSEEKCRIFLKNGVVMVYMKDGSIIVLYPNSNEVRVRSIKKIDEINKESNKKNQNRKTKVSRVSERKSKRKKLPSIAVLEETTKQKKIKVSRYEVIYWNGVFKRFEEERLILEEHIYKLRAALNNYEGLYTIRTDGTKCLTKVDGTHTVIFQDGTTITSVPLETNLEVSPDESLENAFRNPSYSSFNLYEDTNADLSFDLIDVHFSMAHPHYMTTEVHNSNWTIYLPGGIQLSTNFDTGFNIFFDNNTNLTAVSDLITVTSRNPNHPSKQTVGNLFLKGIIAEPYTVCSVLESTGKIFIVNNYGGTNIISIDQSFRSMSAFSRESSVHSNFSGNLQTKSAMFVHKITNSDDKQSLSLFKNVVPHWSNIFYDERFSLNTDRAFQNQKYLTTSSILPYNLKMKYYNRFFVINRNLSGYEYVHEIDNDIVLRKYATACISRDFCRALSIRNKNIIVSQKSLLKNWSESFYTSRNDSTMNTYYLQKRNLSSYLPRNKTWLFDLDSVEEQNIYPRKKENTNYDKYSNGIAISIRKVKDYSLSKDNLYDLFEYGILMYMKENSEILNEYRNHDLQPKNTEEEEDNLLRASVEFIKSSEDDISL